MPGGEQLRTYNGVYLANWQLGRRDAATQSFGQLVDYGLANKSLAMKFLFKPGSTAFLPNPQVTRAYPLWLKQIAARAEQSKTCLEIVGHSSPTGPEPINERLSLRRAESIQQRLISQSPALGRARSPPAKAPARRWSALEPTTSATRWIAASVSM